MTALCCTAGRAAAQYQEREPLRFALVIGDSAYQHLPRLPSAATDVVRMAEKLRALHFSVDEVKLTSAADFEINVLKPFAAKVGIGDIAVVYFSGHGFSYGPHNWLAPLDMPVTVMDGSLADAAVSVENIGAYIAQRSPALILALVDACRAITNFAIQDVSGNDVKGVGVAQDGQFASEVSGIMGYAASPGKTALATALANQLSPFTKGLVSHIGEKGRDFGGLFTEITTDVFIDTRETQRPHFVSWSTTQLYLDPTPEIMELYKSQWMAALQDPDSLEAVSRYALNFAVSPYAAAARDWVRRHHKQRRATQYSALLAVDVESAWDPAAKAIQVAPVGQGFAFARSMDVRLTQEAALTNPDIEIWKGRVSAGSTARLNTALVTALAQEEVVAKREFIARVAPDPTSKVAYRVAEGTRINLSGVELPTARGKWVAATVGGADSLVYLFVSESDRADSVRRLGKALRETLVPSHRTGLRGAIDTVFLLDFLDKLKEEKKDIRWISMATGVPADALHKDIPLLMLTHARAMLRRAGIDGRKVTSITSAPDVPAGVVRIRVFGWDP